MYTYPQTIGADLEVGHVLFVDIVGWSKLTLDRQTATISWLNMMVETSPDFKRAAQGDDLISVPTGDGMALVFFRSPEAPAKLAIYLWHAVQESGQFEIRMGMHSGPIQRMRDITMRVNVAGGGINIAKRVMDLGHPGQILVSEAMKDILGDLDYWRSDLHDLGEVQVKHGLSLKIFSLHNARFGNPAGIQSDEAIVDPPVEVSPVETIGTSKARKVVIVYKRNVQPDEYVLKLVEGKLRDFGHEVFVDRHLRVGVDWAREIQRKIETADAIVPLISLSSVTSEMLLKELLIAKESAEASKLPRILPIRLGYEGLLPSELSQILDSIQYCFWDSPRDDVKLLDELQYALQEEVCKETPAQPVIVNGIGVTMTPYPGVPTEAVGGAMPTDSPWYVIRKHDETFYRAIDAHEGVVLAKGARQMGKTSLLARGCERARHKGSQVAVTDFQSMSSSDMESTESVLKALAWSLYDELNLEIEPTSTWSDSRGPNQNFERYLRNQVFPVVDAHLVWALDEVDRLLTTSFCSEIFGLFRSWYNARATKPEWLKLTQIFGYATEPHLLIKDLNQSPFNVGTHVSMEDFNVSEVGSLNTMYGNPLQGEKELEAIVQLVGGQPFLTRKSLHVMATSGMPLNVFATEAVKDDGPVGDHLKRILLSVSKDSELTEDLREVLRGKPCPSKSSFYRLRSAGVLTGDSEQTPRPRCDLYDHYLRKHLLPS